LFSLRNDALKFRSFEILSRAKIATLIAIVSW
jgi:hypothetical protein